MAKIEMSNAPGVFALVDDEDHGFLSQWSWHLDSKGYARRVLQIDGRAYVRKMHRIISDVPDGVMVDHINGNRLDNRRENLRTATPRQNATNRSASRGRRFKGVYKNKNASTFQSRIKVNGESVYLGSFDDEEAAARAYDAAAIEHHGDYARLNFPDEVPGS